MLDMGDARPTAFAEAFSAAITARRVTLSWLQRHLKDRANPISVATLSYWRSGERHPEGFRSLTVLEDVERLLGLDAGALVGLVDTRTRLGSLSAPQNPFTESQVTRAAEETLRILDAPPIELTRSLSAHVVSTVGDDGLLQSRTSQVLVQAVAPLVQEMTYALMSTENTVRRPECTLRGATLVRDHLHESEHVYACVLRLDRPLPMGATTMLEISMAVSPPEAGSVPQENETAAFVMRPIRNLVLWTRFHPAAVPDWLHEFERTPAALRPTIRSLTPAESIHLSRRDFGPGILGIRWGLDR
jgi:hypothetical protein